MIYNCYFCKNKLNTFDSNTSYNDHVEFVCNICPYSIYYCFLDVSFLNQLFWYINIKNIDYRIRFYPENKKCSISIPKNYHQVIFNFPYLPNITPQNCVEKISSWLPFL